MTSQIVANINTELKNKAMAMAKEEWLTMKALLSFLLKWYVKKEIEIWASFSSLKRDYWTLEIEELSEEEELFLIEDKELESNRLKLNKLISQKCI